MGRAACPDTPFAPCAAPPHSHVQQRGAVSSRLGGRLPIRRSMQR